MNIKTCVGVVAVIAMAVAAGCGSAATNGVSGSSLSDTAAQAYDPATFVESAKVVTAPGPSEAQAAEGSWLSIVEAPNLAPADSAAAEWHGILLAYSAASGGEKMAGTVLSTRSGDGSVQFVSDGVLEPPSGGADLSGGEQQSEESLRAASDVAAEKLGLKVESLGFDENPGLQAAPVLVVQYTGDDPASFVQSHPSVAGELGGGDGPLFAKVVDENGDAIEASGVIPAAGRTIFWRSPKFGCTTDVCTAPEQGS